MVASYEITKLPLTYSSSFTGYEAFRRTASPLCISKVLLCAVASKCSS